MTGPARFGGLRRWEAIVLALSMAAMLGWAAGRQGPQTGFIVVDADPADATVLVDGVKVGARAPVTVERSPGPYTVSVTRDGYQRKDQNVDVVAGHPTPLKIALEASPETGFELTSEPPGVVVWLDGMPIAAPGGHQARTDLRVNRIRPGHHVIEIRDDRFKSWRQELEIEPGLIRKVHAVLLPFGRP